MFETSTSQIQFQFINDQSLSAQPRAIRPHRQPATLSSLSSGVIPAQRRNEIVNVHSIDFNAEEEPIAAWLQDALHAFVKDSMNIRGRNGVEGCDGQVEVSVFATVGSGLGGRRLDGPSLHSAPVRDIALLCEKVITAPPPG